MRLFFAVLCAVLLQKDVRARPDPGCSSPEAVRVAEDALNQINLEQTQGYVLMPNRLYDVSSSSEEGKDGLLYKMTVDVFETECHVSSRKPWKQCGVRNIESLPVYGECEISAFADSQVQLQKYSCVLREVPGIDVVRQCPDCPTADDLNDPIVRDTAGLCLQRFNEESPLANHFRLENITKAYSQWVFGPNYIVEFTIVETVCSKDTDPSEVSSCAPMDCQFAHRGFCVGSHSSREVEFEKVQVKRKKTHSATVNCEIYEPQAAAVEKAAHSNSESGLVGLHLHNHTHLHPHEHEHSQPAVPDQVQTRPTQSRGSVVYAHASKRAAPRASSCPGPRSHRLLTGHPDI